MEEDQASQSRRALRPGTQLGRYTLVRPLAHGGMGELFVARAHGADGFAKLVALKLALPHLSRDPEYLAMFLREARIAAQLDHPNIAHVSDFGSVDGERFIAMEYVDGHNLRVLLKACGEQPMPVGVALGLLLPAASALHYAHELRDDAGEPRGLVHRDVSPGNIIVRADGVVKLVDFGIAKATAETAATRSGILKGKVGYMSPEQCIGNAIDRRSDVFNLGILLYEATTSRRLFFGDNDFAVLNKIVKGSFPPPSASVADYPEALERVVMRCLAVDPKDRYPTAQAFAAELSAYARSVGLDTTPDAAAAFVQTLALEQPDPAAEAGGTSPGPALRVGTTEVSPIPRRKRGRVAAAVGVAAAASGFAVWLAASPDAPADAPREATAEKTSPPEPEPSPPPPKATAAAPAPAPAAQSAAAKERPQPRRKNRRRAPKKTKAKPATKSRDPTRSELDALVD